MSPLTPREAVSRSAARVAQPTPSLDPGSRPRYARRAVSQARLTALHERAAVAAKRRSGGEPDNPSRATITSAVARRQPIALDRLSAVAELASDTGRPPRDR